MKNPSKYGFTARCLIFVCFSLKFVGEDRAGDVERDGDLLCYLGNSSDGATAGLQVTYRTHTHTHTHTLHITLSLYKYQQTADIALC